jgi:NAD(P)-dependent dehydrogenase (short-subunit alcohol dehydrogenase family)
MRGRSYLVTGGAAGIGRAAVGILAERGAKVAVLDVDEQGAQSAAREAEKRGAAGAVAVRCDVSSEQEMERALAVVVGEFGALDGAFANAGIDKSGYLHELALDDWERVLAVNLTGTFLTCKHVLHWLLENSSGGSIVCTSSPAAQVAFGAGAMGAYAASKAGISALVRSSAVDYAKHGIRVNAVVPGPTETELMWATTPPEDRDGMRGVVQSEVPLGRLAHADEVARAAVWLLSDEASFVTGTSLACDGGVLSKASVSV